MNIKVYGSFDNPLVKLNDLDITQTTDIKCENINGQLFLTKKTLYTLLDEYHIKIFQKIRSFQRDEIEKIKFELKQKEHFLNKVSNDLDSEDELLASMKFNSILKDTESFDINFFNWLNNHLEESNGNDHVNLNDLCKLYLNKNIIHPRLASKYKKEMEKYIKKKYPHIPWECKQHYIENTRPRGWFYLKLK
jgi:hypothetical protein